MDHTDPITTDPIDPDPTDAQLLIRTRAGDAEAYGRLFRRHEAVARRVASRSAHPSEVDDIVSEVFTATLVQLSCGRGPTVDLRAYVLTSVRHESARRARRRRRLVLCDDMEAHVDVIRPDRFEHDDLTAAYRSLPVRWRRVLWSLEVEGRRPRELADEFGLTPNAVSALGLRARAGLRIAIAERTTAA